MRRLCLLLMLLTVMPLAAQAPPVATGFESQPFVAPPPAPAPVLAIQPGPSQTLIEPGFTGNVIVEERCPWQFDVILGAPTALRLQRELLPGRLWGEVGVGGYYIFPTAFIGLRTETRLVKTDHHVVAIRPGVDVFYMGGYDDRNYYRHRHRYSFYDDCTVSDFGAVTLDVDFQWRARWSDQFHSLIGLKLGCGAAFGGVTGAVPIVGLTFGGNF